MVERIFFLFIFFLNGVFLLLCTVCKSRLQYLHAFMHHHHHHQGTKIDKKNLQHRLRLFSLLPLSALNAAISSKRTILSVFFLWFDRCQPRLYFLVCVTFLSYGSFARTPRAPPCASCIILPQGKRLYASRVGASHRRFSCFFVVF